MPFITLAEITAFCGAGFVLFRDGKNTIAESVSYAVITTLMLLSFLCQLSLLIHAPLLFYGVELALFIGAAYILFQRRKCIFPAAGVIKAFFLRHPLVSTVFVFGCAYLAILAVFIPPGIAYWNSLCRILLLQQHGFAAGLGLLNSTGPSFPMNHAALAVMFLRAGSDMGVGVFGLLAYISIAASTYALSRRYSWPSTAVTVVLIIISMPRLVFHASSPGNEIIPAATGLFCILAAYRSVERLDTRDLLLLSMGIPFAVWDGSVCIVFPLVLMGVTWILLARRHSAGVLTATILRDKWWALAALAPLVVFSQIWLFWANKATGHSWVGTYGFSPLPLNKNGLQGSIANFFRYLLESIHFTLPIERFFRLIAHEGFTDILEHMANVLPRRLLGAVGLADPFFISWEPNELYSWFGPFAAILVIPAVVFALRRGPRRLKTLAVGLAGYIYLVSLIFAWEPGNVRLFTVLFTCSGVFISFFLPPWRFGRGAKIAIQWVCGLLFFYALIFNSLKPLVPVTRFAEADLLRSMESPILKAEHFGRIEQKNIWLKTAWGRDRIAGARDYFGDFRVQEAAYLLHQATRVAYVTDSLFHVYPFLLMNPNATALIFSVESAVSGESGGFFQPDIILFFGEKNLPVGKNYLLERAWPKNSNAMVSIPTVLYVKRAAAFGGKLSNNL